MAPSAIAAAKLLHWTGKHKPWLADGMNAPPFARVVGHAEVRRCDAAAG